MRNLNVCALVILLAACASSGTATQEQPPAARPAPSEATSTGPSAPTGPSGAVRQTAAAELANARARLQEAQRELEVARSESSTAEADLRGARAQVDKARTAMDSIAQARAAEVVRAAEMRGQTAQAHLDYATKLIAARQADVEAAQLASGETGTAVSVAGAGAGSSASAQSAEAARQRASQLGQAALQAQRRWEEATQRARASLGGATADPTTLGTGSSTTGTAAQPQQGGAPGGAR